ncbi:DUF3592 domain-containing protein [Streptomyces sp. DG2A-72]|uniref:DUF3592 domain-containing protein n=1 Tax=Streptomyces sp. DG2A-72 TaxID=3051386 RepID=UPI00265C5429|nr:DUF3592 domain-containing protein [Streptomyces sp. DG2A-72]MDO0933419.1 DUF3592 domain-containing protein [Streptomyces sp. DG2A-72]
MEALFYVIPLFMIGLAGYAATRLMRRARDIRNAWNNGLTAEARCLRAFTTTSNDSTTQHHVYEFTTHDGRYIRFEEAYGPAMTVEGDIVTVHYLAERPERATAHAPSPGVLAAGSGCALLFLGVFIAFCIAFMLIAHTLFSVLDGFGFQVPGALLGLHI